MGRRCGSTAVRAETTACADSGTVVEAGIRGWSGGSREMGAAEKKSTSGGGCGRVRSDRHSCALDNVLVAKVERVAPAHL